MNTLIEIFGSTLIGSLLILAILTSFYTVFETQFSLSRSLVVQNKATALAEIISSDIHKTGMNIPDSLDAIVEADSARFTFLLNPYGAASVDTVRYFQEERTGNNGNPIPVILRTSVNDTDNLLSVDYSKMILIYFDSSGSETLIKDDIRSVEISLLVEDFIENNNERSRDFRQWRIYLANIINK